MPKKEKEVKEKKQKNSYFKEMKSELKKVTWPTPKELVNTTVSVLAFVIVIAIIVFVLDFAFDAMNKYGITKLQEAVQSSLKSEEANSTDEENVTAGETDANSTEGSESSDKNTAEGSESADENSGEETATEENVAE